MLNKKGKSYYSKWLRNQTKFCSINIFYLKPCIHTLLVVLHGLMLTLAFDCPANTCNIVKGASIRIVEKVRKDCNKVKALYSNNHCKSYCSVSRVSGALK